MSHKMTFGDTPLATGVAAIGTFETYRQALSDVRFQGDIVAKVFLGWRSKIPTKLLMRFTRGEVRDHIVSSNPDHAPP